MERVIAALTRLVRRTQRWGRALYDGDYEAFVHYESPSSRAMLARQGVVEAVALTLYLGLLALVTPAPAHERWLTLGIALVPAGAAVALSRLPQMPVKAMDAMELLCAAPTMTLAGIADGPVSATVPWLYVIVGTSAFSVRRPMVALLHTVPIGVSYAVVLAVTNQSAPWTRWVTVMSTVLVSGGIVRWLIGAVRRLLIAEHDNRAAAEQSRVALTDANAAKSQFLGRMSHELRTPLNAILGFAGMLREPGTGSLDSRQAAYAQDISDAGRHLLDLVDDVLDLTRVEEGRAEMELELEDLDVARSVEDVLTMMRERAMRLGVSLTRTLGPEVDPVRADGRKVRQVLLNLLANAITHTPRGGSVDVQVHRVGGALFVAVHDTGTGIAAADQERIFERFEQGPGASGGTGIGLALSRRIVELHGGRIWVQSAPGAGSTFTFALPAEPPEATVTPPRREARRRSGADEVAAVMSATPEVGPQALVGAAVSSAIGVVLVAAGALTPASATARWFTAGLGVCALGVAFLLRARADRIPPSAMDSLGAFGAVAISVFIYVVPEFADVIALSYGWTTMITFALRPMWIAYVHVALAAVCFAVVLGLIDAATPAASVLGLLTLMAMNGALVRALIRKLRTMVVAERHAREMAEEVAAELATISHHKSDFLASMSHELRTPLNAIIGFSEVLESELAGPLEPRQVAYATEIAGAGRHLLALIDDLLDLAKLDAGRIELHPEPLVVDDLVRGAVHAVTPQADQRGITVSFTVEPPDAIVTVDPARVEQVVVKLLANAVKFTPDGGRASVSATSGEHQLRIAVTDTGIGILPEQARRIFEAFHTGSRPLPDHAAEGTGLGLALAKGIVELHGGTIRVDSVPDAGSTFTFTIPNASAPLEVGQLRAAAL